MKNSLLVILFVLSIWQTQAQSNVFPSNGSVGFGTTTPAYPVHQQVSFLDGYAHVIENTGVNLVRWKIMNATPQGAFEVAVNSSGNTVIQTGKNTSSPTLSILSGNVGIATLSPVYPLDVNGAMHSSVSAGSNLFLSKPTGASIAFDNGSGVSTALIESGSPMAGVGNRLEFWTNTSTNSGIAERMRIDDKGYVGIGTTVPTEMLSVKGNVKAQKMIVTQTGWSDYVFDSFYHLKPLTEVEQFINKNKHLPDIPSAKEVEEKGISVGDNQALLLKKIEELTLYMIEMKKENEVMKKETKKQQEEIELLKNKLNINKSKQENK
jgi:hypothetical protein